MRLPLHRSIESPNLFAMQQFGRIRPGHSMLYHLYELNQAALSPARAAADAYRLLFRNPLNPAAYTPLGRSAAAALELFERTTRRYPKPLWGIDSTEIRGRNVA